MKSVTCPSLIRSRRFDALPPIRRPSATGRIGCREPERAKKTSIQATARAVRMVTTGVARAKRPNAIPEFWTWWIESGPATWRSASSDRWLTTMCFVSWSPASAARAIASEPDPLLRARVQRAASARHGGQRVRRRADADVDVTRRRLAQPRSSKRLQSMQCVAHGIAASRSSAIGLPQLRHVP